MNLTQTVAPVVEPVALSELKLFLKIDDDAENTLLKELEVAARSSAEIELGRQLCTATWQLQLDDFYSDTIRLPKPPLQSVFSIQYVDVDGNTQTLSTDYYTVCITDTPGRINRAYLEAWPTTRTIPDAVTITYVAGYGDASDVPAPIKVYIKQLVGHWYENREASAIGPVVRVVPENLQRILWNYRVYEV